MSDFVARCDQLHVACCIRCCFFHRSNILTNRVCINKTLSVGPQDISRKNENDISNCCKNSQAANTSLLQSTASALLACTPQLLIVSYGGVLINIKAWLHPHSFVTFCHIRILKRQCCVITIMDHSCRNAI